MRAVVGVMREPRLEISGLVVFTEACEHAVDLRLWRNFMRLQLFAIGFKKKEKYSLHVLKFPLPAYAEVKVDLTLQQGYVSGLQKANLCDDRLS